MLECIDVCQIAWYTIMGVSMATYYSWKVNANNRMCVDHQSNVGTTKSQTHTLYLILEQLVDHMPQQDENSGD